MQMKVKKFEAVFFRYIISASVFAVLTAIGAYAYLGTFSRYLADDYCETVRIRSSSSPFAAVIERYTGENWPRVTMRYSNLLFVGFSEMIGPNNVRITIPFMVFLWAAGLIWSIHEIRKFLRVNWFREIDIFLGVTFGFFSLLQAPNIFQTVYWRSAMMTHFAPLVLGILLFAFLLKQAGNSNTKSPSLAICFLLFAASFVIAGFSEPPTTTMVVALPLIMAAIWFLGKSPHKSKYLTLLAWTLAGAFTGLMVMILSPSSANAAQERTLNFLEILSKSFFYSYLFMADSLKTQPLPILISVLIPFSLIWLYGQTEPVSLSHDQKRVIILIIITIPFAVWLLIAAGFSPSVYGQSYPVERMLFLARTIMITSFMLIGTMFGLLIAYVQFKPKHVMVQWMVFAVFITTSIVYPLRAAVNIFRFDASEYRKRAEQWDARDAYIYKLREQGQTDLTVPQFGGVDGVKELDTYQTHWVNRCAARYYQVNSIRAIPVDGSLEEYYNSYGN